VPPQRPTSRPNEPRGKGLVVERYPTQAVVIGDEIEVVLLKVKGDRAQIGVVAPKGLAVTRGEASRTRRADR
jgi:carbon storage regulator CsrA